VYNNLGNLELSCNNTEASLEYYRKSLAIKEKLGDLSSIAFTYLNIGQSLCRRHHDLDMAESFLQKALGMFSNASKNWTWHVPSTTWPSVPCYGTILYRSERLLSEAMETAEKHRAVGFLKEFNGMAVNSAYRQGRRGSRPGSRESKKGLEVTSYERGKEERHQRHRDEISA
jgi:tetratricopeptide (TPR) repeat protein